MEKINFPGFSPYYGPTTGFSRAFQTFIKEIGDAKSKYEEDRIIKREIKYLKDNLGNRNIQPKQMKENLIRLIYCEMLGHDASFGFIHAVNYTQKGKLMDKRIGYLACCLLLHEDHELTLLLMNTIQKDLKSPNIMENCMALIAVTRLVNKDMIPALLPLVSKLLQHKRDIVRKKAVMALLWFHHMDPSSISSIRSKFESTLCDHIPAVMGTTLNVYLQFVTESPADHKRFTSTFVNILKQIIEFRLPNEFTYYNVPAPWLQIKLLKILAYLGHEDQRTSEIIYEVLKQCLETTHIENNIGCAVLSECLRTTVTIFPNKALTELASRRVGLLLVSRNKNLKYLGINILADLIEVDVSYVSRHQMTVIDCLNDPDETLKRKTIVLLYRMTNASNVAVICDKMITYLRSSVDEYLRADLVNRITTLAEKFAPDNEWFIETMNTVFELGGSLVRPQVAHNLMRLIGEGTDDDDLDNELRLHAVNSYLDLIEKDSVPDILMQVICWVIGEYSYLATHCDPEDVLEKLCLMFRRRCADDSILQWVVTAITKITAQIGYIPDKTKEHVEEQLNTSNNLETKQRCAEVLCMFDVFQSLDEVLPPDASCEDLEVDSTLSFLDGFVADALSKGAAPYQPEHLREIMKKKQNDNEGKQEKSLNLTPYPEYKGPEPTVMKMPVAQSIVESQPQDIHSSFGGMILPTGSSKTAILNTKKPTKVVWGSSGYIGDKRRGDSFSMDQTSDTSSTTSGADSGSFASDRIPKKEDSSSFPSIPNIPIPKDEEKIKLAEQLFSNQVGPRSDKLRPEKAGFSAKRRTDRRNKETKKVVKSDNNSEQKESPTLLLDFDDSGVGENSGTEQIYSNETERQFESRNQLIDDLIIDQPEVSKVELAAENEVISGPIAELKILDEVTVVPEIGEIESSESQEAHDHVNSSCLKAEIGEYLVQGGIEDNDQRHTHKTGFEDLLDSIDQECDVNASQKQERRLPVLPEHLELVKHSEMQTICEDTNLKFSCQKVFTEDSLTVVLFVVNQRPLNLREILLFFQPPSNSAIILDGAIETTCFDEEITEYGYTRHILCLTYNSPSLNMVLGGHLSYKDSTNTQKRLFINYSLTVFDFLRPLKIDTQTYGKKWGSTAYEKRQQIEAKQKSSIAEICQIVEQNFHFQIVEIIGSEAITAGLINKDHCLLHCKYSHSVIEFRLKTGSKLLNDCILNGIVKSMSTSNV